MINLRQLEIKAGSEEGARKLFQDLIADLMRIKYRNAKEIRPDPGDWGIDVLVGELTSGTCMIWQAKYLNKIGKTQKKEIRESFKQVIKKSQECGFKIDVWTLCVPCSLSTKETQWWEGWKRRNMKKTGVKIDLMHKLVIIEMLRTSEAKNIRLDYFGEKPSELKEKNIQELPDRNLYKNSAFIRKLVAAQITENLSAKTQFFNAELLKKEIKDRGDENESSELISLYEKIFSMWETRFNEALNNENPEIEVSKVYSKMLYEIEKEDKNILNSPGIRASFVHKQGFMQQLADLCRIGWTPDFRVLDTGGDGSGT